MADSNIGALPKAEQLDDDSLLVAEQQGTAVKVTGAQFKEFGRQAVIDQVQGYVDQAEAAADRAVDAVSTVTGMTVEAHPSDTASVSKTMKDGKVNLAFGLPRGEQGLPGSTGPEGPRGPQGPTGKGLTILGYYDTPTALEAAVPSPSAGDAYGVGTAAPYDIYVFDGAANEWKNNGPLAGGGGGSPLPENVVTSDGGASLEIPDSFGAAPHVIEFLDEEEPPLTAEDIQYSDTEDVKQAIDGLKSSVSNGKSLIASAITDKGVETAQDATFAQMAENIGQITGGSDTSDATATSFDILSPKTAYTAAGKVEGVIPTLLGQTIVPGTADKTIANGQYLGGTQVIKGDPNLTSSNIKSGVTLFGVEGALESTFQATLTVTADAGAVVTATHTNGTKVEALSANGTVVLELPLEGQWTVTARRGVAQYNSVVINVSSKYTAALTAEVHIEYVGPIDNLKEDIYGLSAAGMTKYALFGGGRNIRGSSGNDQYYVTAYDKNLTRSYPDNMFSGTFYAATSLPDKVVFGYGDDKVFSYDENLTKTIVSNDSGGRNYLAAASIGTAMLFGGGYSGGQPSTIVDAYDSDLTHTTPTGLISRMMRLGAASNGAYAIFAGGSSDSGSVTAYNSSLTRTTPSALSVVRTEAAGVRAGNYVLFAGGYNPNSGTLDAVDAYDLFLTHTIAEPLSINRTGIKGTTLNEIALLGGGYDKDTDSRDAVKIIETYDQFLVRSIATELQIMRCYHAAASVGNYALFGGGATGDIFSYERSLDSVEAYQYV